MPNAHTFGSRHDGELNVVNDVAGNEHTGHIGRFD